MQAQELTNTQALIDQYYSEEREKQAQALNMATLSLQLDANNLAMLNTIAKRFSKSREDLARDVLENALIDLLSQIESGERKLIARDADEAASSLSQEIAEENGLKEVQHKPGVWVGHERNITKIEKKRAKEMEEARKAEAAEQQSADLQEESSSAAEAMTSEPASGETSFSQPSDDSMSPEQESTSSFSQESETESETESASSVFA